MDGLEGKHNVLHNNLTLCVIFLTRKDCALDPVIKRAHPHPEPALVLPVVVGIIQLGAVQSLTGENPHQGKAAILLFSYEGTSCTERQGITS